MRDAASFLVVALATAAAVSLSACGSGGGNQEGCPPGFADCDGDPSNGCETNIATIENCGECGNFCSEDNARASCVEGTCQLTCDPGFGNCDLDAASGCEEPLNSETHCGSCWSACAAPNADGKCVLGHCQLTCAAGWGDCNQDMLDGCESELDRDLTCGSCDHGCTTTCTAALTCEVCDAGVLLDSDDPYEAVKAMGICGDVVSARWVQPDGSDPPVTAEGDEHPNFWLGRGNLSAFGPNVSPRFGSRFLVLSSGAARAPGDPDYRSPSGFSKGYSSNHPFGFPKESPSCPNTVTGAPFDGIGLEVELEVPDWAQGLAFDFAFYTFEWPSFICSRFNDFFVALLEPFPEGQTDGNISFDQLGNPVSVNNAFMTVCGCFSGPPCTAGGKTFTCENGTDALVGTGFESHAATTWLTTRAPVEPGSTIKLTFAVYDSGDGILDSTALIDNFRWLATPPPVETVPID